MSTAVDIRPGPGDHDVQLLVRVDLIRPAADNLRRQLGDLASLTASIAASGVQQPLRLVPVDPTFDGDEPEYEVVDGHRRLAAAVEAGLGWVPAIVRRMSDAERVEAMLTTALLREDLLPSEEAEGYRRLVETGLSQREIAKRFGVNQSHISKTLKLVALPERARDWVDSGGITRELAQVLAGLPADVQAKLVECDRPDPYEIEHQARREAMRQKRLGAEKAAADTGRPVIDPGDVGCNPNGGAMWLSYLRGEGRLGCAEDLHLGGPCHAVAWQGSEMAAVCVDPVRHPLPEPEPVPEPPHYQGKPRQSTAAEIKAEIKARDAQNAQRSQEQAERARRREQAQVQRARRVAYHRHLVGLVGVNKIIGLAAVMLPMGSDDTDLGGVARALGIPLFDVKVEQVPLGDDAEGWYAECVCGSVEESDAKADIEAWKSAHLAGHDTDHSDDPEWDEIVPKLHEFAARDIRNEAQVVYALALTVGEGFAEPRERGSWQGPEGDFERGMRSRYFDFLTAEGYELSELERSWLPQPQEGTGVPSPGVASDGEAVRPDSAVESEAEPPAPPERRRCEQCGGIPTSRISPRCVACEKAQAERQAAVEEYEGQVITRVLPGNIERYDWECTCGSAGGRLIEDPDEAAEDLDTHMLDAHGYSPVEAV